MQEFLRENSFDACGFITADWFEWAGNHPVRELAWERPYLLVFTASGRTIGFLSEQSRNHIAAECERETLWIDRLEFYAESPAAADRGWTTPSWPKMVAETLIEEGLGKSRMAFDASNRHLHAAVSRLPELHAQIAPANLRNLRHVKHPREIATMQLAASLSDWALARLGEELYPGCNLAAVGYAVAAKLSLEAARRLPLNDYAITTISTLSGPESACPKGDGSSCGRQLQDNAVAMTTIVTRLDGLSMELARPWLVGTPPKKALRYFRIVAEAHDAALEAARPQQPLCRIHEAAQKVFDAYGLGKELVLRSGHGVGVSLHEFPEDLPFTERAIMPNEVLAIEPGAYFPELGGFRFADTVVIRADGAHALTRSARDVDGRTLANTRNAAPKDKAVRPALAGESRRPRLEEKRK
jgi:Xaa-Pro aminopeptidase/Xaa-Pro dipeptidase